VKFKVRPGLGGYRTTAGRLGDAHAVFGRNHARGCAVVRECFRRTPFAPKPGRITQSPCLNGVRDVSSTFSFYVGFGAGRMTFEGWKPTAKFSDSGHAYPDSFGMRLKSEIGVPL
jgi:hypothetical protein